MPEYRVTDSEGLWGSIQANNVREAHKLLFKELYPEGSLNKDYVLTPIKNQEEKTKPE